MSASRGIATVLFDLDGTLVDSLRDLHACVNHILGVYGRAPLSREVVRDYIGDGVKVLLSRSFLGWEDHQAAPRDDDYRGRTWQEIEQARRAAIEALLQRAGEMRRPTLDEAVRTFRAYYAEHLTDFTTLYPGVREALDELSRRGIAMGVVTNKPEHHSDRILVALKARRYFQVLVGGDTLPATKPDPAPLHHAMQAAGAAPPATLMVGDSGNDILAGRNAGCRTAAVAFGFNPVALLRKYEPDWVLEDCRDLLSHPELSKAAR
jgi:phosphoglycolate phosphatase